MAKVATSHLSKTLQTRLSQLPIAEQEFIFALTEQYPEIKFRCGRKFAFQPPNTVFIGPIQPYFALQTLHELGHALSKHKDYKTHVERLKIESEAWERAKTLYQNLKNPPVSWSDDYMEDCLDTYRDWLHTNSLCPKCKLTRYQSPDGKYHCPHCETFI